MGRMDRHKKDESGMKLPVRREKKRSDEAEIYQAYQEPEQSTEPAKQRNWPFSKKKGTPVYSEPKKQHRVRNIILGILLFLVLYSIVTFAIGNFAAKHDTSIPQVKTEEFNGVTSSSGKKNILLLGSDTRDTETGRADSIMVLQVDGAGKPKLVSFMRDMYVNIPGVGENKLNAAFAYGGAELVRQTLKQNFGVDCRYYAMVDFKTFEKGVDSLFPRGVKIDAEKDMSSYIDQPITKGEQRMNGHTLLNYSRFRMDEEGDFGRVRRQQQVMGAVFSQIKNPLVLLRGPYAAGKVIGYMSTDMSSGFLVLNSFNFAKAVMGFERLTLPVEGSWSYGDSYNAGSVLNVDFDQNAQAAANFLGD